jgi:hypothetical protein
MMEQSPFSAPELQRDNEELPYLGFIDFFLKEPKGVKPH